MNKNLSKYVTLYFSFDMYNIEAKETTVNVYPDVMNFAVKERLSGMKI